MRSSTIGCYGTESVRKSNMREVSSYGPSPNNVFLCCDVAFFFLLFGKCLVLSGDTRAKFWSDQAPRMMSESAGMNDSNMSVSLQSNLRSLMVKSANS